MMFALEAEFLTGRYVATACDDRESAEWPPHPSRLFSALVAAHVERDSQDLAEWDALRWLEVQAPPSLSFTEASPRDVMTVFVPVNDNTGPENVPKKGFSYSVVADKIRVLPERRSKQPRSFPSVTPVQPFVVFIWEGLPIPSRPRSTARPWIAWRPT